MFKRQSFLFKRCFLKKRFIPYIGNKCNGHFFWNPLRYNVNIQYFSNSSIQKYAIPSLPSKYSILAIESSCDDTSLCLLSNDEKIIFEKSVSQDDIHSIYKGVYPFLAGERHRIVLPRLLSELRSVLNSKISESDNKVNASSYSSLSSSLSSDSNVTIPPIGVIAATRGPGMSSSLAVGWNSAKILASFLGLPLMGIHHMEGHALMARFPITEKEPLDIDINRHDHNLISNNNSFLALQHDHNRIQFPYLCLLISGGHTLLVWIKDVGEYTILGRSLDDAIGEALDKGGRALGLSWSVNEGSGYAPSLEKMARKGNPEKFPFSIPLNKSSAKKEHPFDFSFSGLKTALLSKIEEEKVKIVSLASKNNIINEHAASPSSKMLEGTLATAVDVGIIGTRSRVNISNASDRSLSFSSSVSMEGRLPEDLICDLSASYQKAATNHLKARLVSAIRYVSQSFPDTPCHAVVVSGGVARNQYIRSELMNVSNDHYLPIYFPPQKYCTDNAVMIAWAALERLRKKIPFPEYSWDADIKPVWSLENIDCDEKSEKE